MTRTRILIIPVALAMLAAVPLSIGYAHADGDKDARRAEQHRVMAAATVDAAGAIAAVKAAGYSVIREVDWDDGAWEIKANDAQGQKAKLRVDPTSAAVTRKGF